MQGTQFGGGGEGYFYSSFTDNYFPTHNHLEVVSCVHVALGDCGEIHWRKRWEEDSQGREKQTAW